MSTVITKRSSTAGVSPVAGDLSVGELAVNTADGKLYTKHTDNSIVLLNPAGSSSSVYSGTATIDFGSLPGSNEASIVVGSQTGIAANTLITLRVDSSDTTTDHTGNDHTYFALLAALSTSISVNTSFTIKARSLEKLTGTWKIKWSWI
jgi:hypothetical protein